MGSPEERNLNSSRSTLFLNELTSILHLANSLSYSSVSDGGFILNGFVGHVLAFLGSAQDTF